MNTKKTGRGPKISSGVRQLIISQAIHDSKTMPRRALAVRLQNLLETMGEPVPTEDTLARMISEARNKQPSDLEKPWCIGACDYYNIPSDMIPIINEVQQLKAIEHKEEPLGEISVREARWIARLYPVMKPIMSKLAMHNENELLWLLFIAISYAQRERVSEQINEQYPNTIDLDRLYFHGGGFLSDDALLAWWNALLPEHRQALIDSLEKKRPMLLEASAKIQGRTLSSEEVNMIDNCFDIVKNGGLVSLRDFIGQSPLAQENDMLHVMTGFLFSIAISGGLK